MSADFAGSKVDDAPKAADPVDSGVLVWVGGVALNLWLVAVAIPALRGVPGSPLWQRVFAGLTLLGVFVAVEAARRRRGMFLLVAFPALIFVHLILGFGAQDGFALIAASGAMAAYVATASSVGSRPRWRSVRVRSLGERAPARDAARRAALRRGVTGLVAFASFGVGVVVPALGFDEASWSDEAQPAAQVMVAVMSGLVATLMLAAFAGPAARRRRKDAVKAGRRAQRVMMLLTVALFGALLAFAISR